MTACWLILLHLSDADTALNWAYKVLPISLQAGYYPCALRPEGWGSIRRQQYVCIIVPGVQGVPPSHAFFFGCPGVQGAPLTCLHS